VIPLCAECEDDVDNVCRYCADGYEFDKEKVECVKVTPSSSSQSQSQSQSQSPSESEGESESESQPGSASSGSKGSAGSSTHPSSGSIVSDSSKKGGLAPLYIGLIAAAGVIVVGAACVGLIFLIRYCIKEKGPSVGIATSQHDVLFDDEDDVDLTPVPKKNKKGGDEDAFI